MLVALIPPLLAVLGAGFVAGWLAARALERRRCRRARHVVATHGQVEARGRITAEHRGPRGERVIDGLKLESVDFLPIARHMR